MHTVSMASREVLFSAFVEAAKSAPFYHSWLAGGHTLTPEMLAALPKVTLRQLEEHPEEFRSGRHSRNGKAKTFRYPLEHEPKVAMLMDGFRSTGRIRNFSDFDLDELSDLQSDTLAAPLAVMHRMTRLTLALRYPAVVFTGPKLGYLTEADRDEFWKVFGVPIFEQFTGLGGEVLAEECEAHEGLHIREAEAIFEVHRGELLVTSLTRLDEPVFRLATGLHGRLDAAPCD